MSAQLALRAVPAVASAAPSSAVGRSTPQAAGEQSLATDLGVAPAVAPWLAGRVGIQGDNEAGLAYTGRGLRLDARHAFELGSTTLSLGLGASALAARRPDESGSGVYGGGLDLPLLFGWRSRGDVYCGWLGPRGGVELLRGRVLDSELGPTAGTATLLDAKLTHLFVGGVAGARIGFRHVHVAIELDAAYHHVAATLGARSATLDQVTLTPSGALVATF